MTKTEFLTQLAAALQTRGGHSGGSGQSPALSDCQSASVRAVPDCSGVFNSLLFCCSADCAERMPCTSQLGSLFGPDGRVLLQYSDDPGRRAALRKHRAAGSLSFAVLPRNALFLRLCHDRVGTVGGAGEQKAAAGNRTDCTACRAAAALGDRAGTDADLHSARRRRGEAAAAGGGLGGAAGLWWVDSCC